MAGEFDQITNALKNVYPSKALEAMTNEETVFRKALMKNLPAGGRASEGILKFGANFSPPQNVGQTIDAGALPAPIDRTQDQFKLVPTIFAGGFEIGWITKKAAKSNKGAFNGGELRRRTEETVSELGKFIEQTYTGTHGTGRRATVDGATSAVATFTAAKPLGALLLKENHRISVRTTDGGATVRNSLDNIRISAINYETRVVTLASGTYTLVDGDHVHVVVGAAQVLAPNFGSNGTTNMANGLRGLVDDATNATYIHELSRTTYPKAKANVSANGGSLRNLTEQVLVRACHENRARSGKKATDLWTGPGQVEKYIEFVAPDRRYMVSGSGVQGMGTGYKNTGDLVHYAPGVALKFNMSYDISPREIYLLNWDTFFHYISQDMDWWNEGDMLLPTPNSTTYKASYLAFVGSIENIGCDMPLGNTLVKDLKDPIWSDA